jgi:hypothetical protein
MRLFFAEFGGYFRSTCNYLWQLTFAKLHLIQVSKNVVSNQDVSTVGSLILVDMIADALGHSLGGIFIMTIHECLYLLKS